jgi:hypothetical protein
LLRAVAIIDGFRVHPLWRVLAPPILAVGKNGKKDGLLRRCAPRNDEVDGLLAMIVGVVCGGVGVDPAFCWHIYLPLHLIPRVIENDPWY